MMAVFTTDPTTNEPEIVASNCVLHKLAEDSEDMCQLDLSLLSSLLDSEIEHRECMVRGGLCCRFGILRS